MNQNTPARSTSQPEPQDGPENVPDLKPARSTPRKLGPKKRRGRAVLRALLAFVLVLAVLVAAVFVYRSAIINLLAPSFLSRAGLQQATFHLRDISTNHVSIDYATGLLPASGGTLQVALEEVEYDFNFAQLLAGKVERFKVGRAELSLPAWRSSPVEEEQSPQAFSFKQFFQILDNIKTLPLESLHIENLVLHASLNGEELDPPALLLDYKSTPGGGSLLLQERSSQGQETALSLTLTVDGKKMDASLDAELADLKSWLPQHLQAYLPLDRGRLQMQAQVDQEGQKQHIAKLNAQGTGIGHIDWQAASFTLNLHASSPAENDSLVLADDSQLAVQGLEAQGLQLDAATLPLQGSLQVLADAFAVDWQPQQTVELKGLRLAGMRAGLLTAHPVAARLQIARASDHADPAREWFRLSTGPATRLELKQLTAPGLQLSNLQAPLPLEVQFFHNRQEWRWRPETPLAIQGMKTGNTAFAPLKARNIDLRFTKNPERSLLQADFLLPEASGGTYQLNWEQKATDATNLLTLQTKKPLKLGADNSPLKVLAKPPAAFSAVSIEQGELGAELRLNWGKAPLDARLNLDLRNAAANHANMRYSGISLQHTLQLAPQLRSVQAGSLAVAAIDGPIKLEDLSAKVQVLPPEKKGETPVLLVKEGGLRVFDGRVQTANCRYDTGRSSNTCTFTLHNLDLAAILALHQVEGLDVSGRLNGKIPVRHDKAGFSVADGSLTNAGAGGVIHYQPSSEALKSSPYSEYVLKALEDYRYHSLAATVSYEPDGTLIAGLQLQGKSPELETNRPVHLNLQAEQNLLSLLKSLQYSQGLTSELNRRVQERFQPKEAK